MEKITPRFWILTIMIFAAAFVRLLPHPPNFAPIAAMALFGGAYFNKKSFAFAVPLVAMFLTDAIIGFHSGMWIVYLSFALIVVIGMLMLKKVSIKNVVLASVTASLSFFIITNFGVWAFGTMYPKNIAGLVECYIAAIPFIQNTLLGDLFFSGVMFGIFEFAKTKLPALAQAKA
ncbi:DUF6580 family putative transport protein [Ignavibacterium sp.]|uniref:DUF6580 family putative transport protein n=1 Tax=Ignavibacterium sp. TaxID=2651167 RepID=UPI00220EFFF1|nr:DUF6580 family putative transport protein [Ignavibacterium sp.]BDQ02629.1 MAG: hypothetical protein KatS3mg037_1204 [Ignavibacterium sp.]